MDETRGDRRARGTVRVLLHHVAHADAVAHAEPEPAEGVPREPAPGQRHVFRAGKRPVQRVRGPTRGRGGHAAAGHADVHMADDHPEQRAVRAGHTGGLVERPEPEARAVHADARGQRTGPRGRPAGVRLLLLRAAHGNGRHRGRGSHGSGRRQDGAVQRDVQLHLGRVQGKCSPASTGRDSRDPIH